MVTGSADRYRHDIFYRTGWNVVLLQIGFTTLLLVLVAFALSSLYEDVVLNLIRTFTEALTSKTVPVLDGAAIVENLEYTKNRNVVLAGTGVLMLASIFGYLVTRLALTPTRNALESQKQFVGNIAHELRTPLSIIKTNTEVALLNENVSKDMREMLDSNVEELNRISDIINNLLSMNRLIRPEKIAFTNIDLHSIIERVTSALDGFAKRKGIEVAIDEQGQQQVWGNASGVEQIIMNVAKNAINYTPQDGRIRIAVEPNYQGEVDITISDTGMGIPEKDLIHIFEPFYRGDSSRNRQSGAGSGLGLAIVHELVKLHKGRISIRSAVGQGTAVQITLPAGRRMKKSPV